MWCPVGWLVIDCGARAALTIERPPTLYRVIYQNEKKGQQAKERLFWMKGFMEGQPCVFINYPRSLKLLPS